MRAGSSWASLLFYADVIKPRVRAGKAMLSDVCVCKPTFARSHVGNAGCVRM